MGVKGLLKLLEPVGRVTGLEALSGKILAIDASIWLTQFIKAMRDEEGKLVKNAHLIGTMRRVLKLLYYKIKPVFVFDGKMPALKLRTLKQRKVIHQLHEGNYKRAAEQILLNQMKQQLIRSVRERNKHQQQDTVDEEHAEEEQSNLVPSFHPFRPASKQTQPSQSAAMNMSAAVGAANVPGTTTSTSQTPNTNISCTHWPQPGVRVSYNQAPLGAVSLGRVSRDRDRYSSARGRGLLAVVFQLNTVELAYPQEALRVMDPCTDCFPQFLIDSDGSASDSSREEAASTRHRNGKKNKKAAGKGTSGATTTLVRPSADSTATSIERISKKRGRLYDSDSQGGGSDSEGLWSGAGSEDSDGEFVLPAGGELDVSQLAAMPLSMRRQILEASQRQERAKKRNLYIPVAHDPDRFSQTQLSNFLNSSKVNRRFNQLQKELESSNQKTDAKASQGPSETDDDDDDDDDDSRHETSRSGRRHVLVEESGSGSDEKERAVGANPGNNTARHAAASDEDSDVGGGFLLPQSLKKPAPEQCPAREPPLLSKRKAGALETTEVTTDPPCLRHAGPLESVAISPDSSGSDVDWESNSGAALAAENEAISVASSVGDDDHDRDNWMSQRNKTSGGYSQLLPSSSTTAATAAGANAEVIRRAVSTASHMAGWAADVVQKTLRSHAAEQLRLSDATTATMITSTEAVHGPPVHTPNSLSSPSSVLAAVSDRSADIVAVTDDVMQSQSIAPAPDMSQPVVRINLEEEVAVSSASNTAAASVAMAISERELREEEEGLLAQRVRAGRDQETVTLQMQEEVKQLLALLRLPFVVAPQEAEAQCSVLEALGLVDGVVSEDSDSLLFGARTIYKNLFDDKRNVEVFKAADIEHELGLNRNELIGIAYLLGSDYCEGVHGVGIVNAVEILQAFDLHTHPVEGLTRFSAWLNKFEINAEMSEQQEKKGMSEEGRKVMAFEQKHRTERRRWSVPSNFPDAKIAEAYRDPVAERDLDAFEFAGPEEDPVRRYCQETLGWTDVECERKLTPVLRRWADNAPIQTRIDSYFSVSYEDNRRFAKIKSARLRDAVVSITGQDNGLSIHSQ